MDFALTVDIIPAFLKAAVISLEISVCAFFMGLLVAATTVAGRLSRFFPFRMATTAFVSVFRGTPCLIQLLILYFGGAQFGLDLSPFAAGAIGLALNVGAYMSEAIRGAILSIDRGQTEAARSLGFGRAQTMFYFVLPQASILIVRSLGVNAIILLKGSALVSTISVVELTYTAQRFISSTYKPFEVFSVAAAIYMVLVYGVAAIFNQIDAKLSQKWGLQS